MNTGAMVYDKVNMQDGKSAGDIPEAIAPVVEDLKQQDAVLALILFGSVARGCERPFSDIDLCIVTGYGTPEAVRAELLGYGSGKIDVSIFSELPVQIRFRVMREGKVLFVRDPLALHRILASSVREYLDIAPLIRRYCRHAIAVSGE